MLFEKEEQPYVDLPSPKKSLPGPKDYRKVKSHETYLGHSGKTRFKNFVNNTRLHLDSDRTI